MPTKAVKIETQYAQQSCYPYDQIPSITFAYRISSMDFKSNPSKVHVEATIGEQRRTRFFLDISIESILDKMPIAEIRHLYQRAERRSAVASYMKSQAEKEEA